MNDVNIGNVKTTIRPEREGYHHGDLRNALLEAAVRLVAQKGPEGFSLREAAREVGVSPAAAYRHFADKLALLTALAADAHGRDAGLRERLGGGGHRQRPVPGSVTWTGMPARSLPPRFSTATSTA